MFLLLAAAPLKVVYNTFEGTMSNAGGRPSDFGPPSFPRSQSPKNVYTIQPQKQSAVVQQPKKFAKVEVSNACIHLGPEPIFITCPSCFQLITTKVTFEKGENSSNSSCLMCCSNSRKDALHYCPSCHAFLGKFVP